MAEMLPDGVVETGLDFAVAWAGVVCDPGLGFPALANVEVTLRIGVPKNMQVYSNTFWDLPANGKKPR